MPSILFGDDSAVMRYELQYDSKSSRPAGNFCHQYSFRNNLRVRWTWSSAASTE